MRPLATLALLAPAASLAAQQDYSEGVLVPRHATPEELRAGPGAAASMVIQAPTGPVRCPAEYEPMEAILMSWEGPESVKEMIVEMAREITTIGGADLHLAVDTTSDLMTARSQLLKGRVSIDRVQFILDRTNSIWMRDYGPRYVYEGDCRAIVDHTYNLASRRDDNEFPIAYAAFRGHERYHCGLVHGGGNFHLDATGKGRATRLIVHENPSLTTDDIKQRWADYQNLDVELYNRLPGNIDSTQHIDMWMQVIDDDAVVISDWPTRSGTLPDRVCDNAAVSMALEGYTVHRVPAFHENDTHYTYTNVVMCNDLVLIPRYDHPAVAPSNAIAEAAWQAALPNKTIVPIDTERIVIAAGVMHCIVMHVPEPLGGDAPTAYLRAPNDGTDFVPSSTVEIGWITDDDEAVTNVKLHLSTDGGLTFPTTLATDLPPNGKFAWTVPATCTTQACIRVVATDADGNSGFDDSDTNFTIDAAACAAHSVAYGVGKPGVGGMPALTATTPRIGAPLTLSVAHGPPNQMVFLGSGPAVDAMPFDGGTVLVLSPVFTELMLDALGTADMTLLVPNIPQLEGLSLFWQGWMPGDPGATGVGWSATNGVETRFGF